MPEGTNTNPTEAARGDSSSDFFHVRTSTRLKKDVRGAAGRRDQDMSEYIREVLDAVANSDHEIEEILAAAKALNDNGGGSE